MSDTGGFFRSKEYLAKTVFSKSVYVKKHTS